MDMERLVDLGAAMSDLAQRRTIGCATHFVVGAVMLLVQSLLAGSLNGSRSNCVNDVPVKPATDPGTAQATL